MARVLEYVRRVPPDPQPAQPPVIVIADHRGLVGYATRACLVVILLGVSVAGLVSTTVMWAVVDAGLLLLSPILIPLGILFVIGSVIAFAFLTTVLVFLAPLIWLIRYLQGNGPYGSVQVDIARHGIAGFVRHFTG